jgi:hypothetical protein
MIQNAKRNKSSARMPAPSSFTAGAIPESQETGAALERAELRNAIKSILHSQQPGLFPTQIRDRLIAERKELVEKYSSKESIKTALNQALTRMIASGEVARQEATTNKGGRSHLYILHDVTQPQSGEESNDRSSRDPAKDIFTQHSIMPLVDVSDLQSPRPFKVESQPPSDSQPDQRKTSYSETHTPAQVGGSEQPRSVIQSEEETRSQLQLPDEARVSQRPLPRLCAGDVSNGPRSAGTHSNSPSQKFDRRVRVQETPDDRATLSLDYQEPTSARFDENQQHTNPVIGRQMNGSPGGLDRSLDDNSKTTMAELGKRVIHCRKLKARRDELVQDKAAIESERDDARSELSKLLSLVDQDMQRMEALHEETQKLQDRMLELERGSSNAKQQVDEGKQIVELKTLEVQECEEIVKVIEAECSSICQKLSGLVHDLDIV